MKIFQFCHACALAMGILSLRFGYFRALEDTISPDFSQQMTYLGDASFNAGTIELTLDPLRYSLYNSSGRALYSFPVRLLDPFSHRVASFSTSFSFAISPATDSRFGDGLAFIIVADRYEVGDYGFDLGVYDKSTNVAAVANHTFAVEFDTHQNQETGDMNGNHVGIDLTSATSVIAADAAIAEVILTDSSEKTSWIDYNGGSNLLEIRLSNNATIKPAIPLISANINLSQIFHEYMFVGFAAATGGGSQELHTILSWNFSTWGLQQQSSHRRRSNGALALAAGLSVGFIIAAIAAAVVAFQLISGRTGAFEEMEKEMMMPQTVQVFSYKEIRSATRGFSDAEKLGYGGFGSVFKGVLPRSGTVVAVKRVVCDDPKLPYFLAEVNTIGSLRHMHRNLVHLYGWCSDGVSALFLVYEYLPNGSLHRHLFQSKDVLPWTHRYTIVSGIAAALLHLHERDVKIVHGDVKPSNVMLDCNFNAKLGDFGLARQQYAQLIDDRHGSSRSRSSSTVVAGTFGYIAPEAVETGKSTTETDVFSFGAVLLEVGCGRRALDRSLAENEAVLVDRVWSLHEQGQILEAADQRLGNAYDVEEMALLLKLGLLCSHPDPPSRPTMKQITLILSGDATLPPCKQPTAASDHPPAQCCMISIDQLLANTSSSCTSSSDTSHIACSSSAATTQSSMDDLTVPSQSRRSLELMTNSFHQLM